MKFSMRRHGANPPRDENTKPLRTKPMKFSMRIHGANPLRDENTKPLKAKSMIVLSE